jgi:hypothetical protein
MQQPLTLHEAIWLGMHLEGARHLSTMTLDEFEGVYAEILQGLTKLSLRHSEDMLSMIDMVDCKAFFASRQKENTTAELLNSVIEPTIHMVLCESGDIQIVMLAEANVSSKLRQFAGGNLSPAQGHLLSECITALRSERSVRPL